MTKKLIFFGCLAAAYAAASVANTTNLLEKQTIFHRPLYAGVTFAYGATTWEYLVSDDPSVAMSLSTPTNVQENGEEWGIVAGYEFLPTFALEASYDHYPRAKVSFDSQSIFSFEHDGIPSFYTNTESISLIGKFMVLIPRNENFRAFAGAGAAIIHREDILNEKNLLTAKFNIGGDFAISDTLMVEFGIDYTAGNGVSELDPAEHFIPFLYSVFTRLVLRF